MEYKIKYKEYKIVATRDRTHSIDFKVYQPMNDEMELLLEGHVKWDECSNWNIGSKDVMLHFCSKNEAEDLGKLLGFLYELACSMLKNADSYWKDEENYENILSEARRIAGECGEDSS